MFENEVEEVVVIIQRKNGSKKGLIVTDLRSIFECMCLKRIRRDVSVDAFVEMYIDVVFHVKE